MSAVLRFAPSPNGRLHLGHAYSALLNAKLASELGGRLLLRIENIDPARSRTDFERSIEEDLAWLGLAWEQPVRRQSEHLAEYRAAATGLQSLGLLYPCFCSRGDIARRIATRAEGQAAWPSDPDGAAIYPGTCRVLTPTKRESLRSQGRPHHWRLDMTAALAAAGAGLEWTSFERNGAETPIAGVPARWGDAIIVRKGMGTSYHLSVVVDDACQSVTHVVRGRDLAPSTDLHVLLQRLLGRRSPLYHHHALILDPSGRKLSKSANSPSLADLRAAGASAADIRAQLGFSSVPA